MAIERVGVVGCGLMGSGIAEICARAGLDVLVTEMDNRTLEAGETRVRRSLERAMKSGKIPESEIETVFGRIRFSTDLGKHSDRQLMVEAIVEAAEPKVELFRELDLIVSDPDAILTTNTSSIPIMKLAVATKRPQQVCGLHFFNPVPVLRLVELIPSLMTSDQTTDTLSTFSEQVLGKHVVRSQDRAGFIVNALLIPYILSAVRMVESGFATADDIDAGMVDGCNHPMGPLALCDLIGLDTAKAVADSMYEEFKEPLYSAPPLLCRMVEAGLLGRKSGRGFYNYAK